MRGAWLSAMCAVFAYTALAASGAAATVLGRMDGRTCEPFGQIVAVNIIAFETSFLSGLIGLGQECIALTVAAALSFGDADSRHHADRKAVAFARHKGRKLDCNRLTNSRLY